MRETAILQTGIYNEGEFMNIMQMGRDELLALRPETVQRALTADEVVYMATVLGAFWAYDYKAASEGRFGRHALLKSERHSDGFFVSKILLAYANILRIMAYQMVMKLVAMGVPRPDFVVGVPDGATSLGNEIAKMLDAPVAEMKKIDGQLVLTGSVYNGAELLVVEDFCTRGTSFAEAILELIRKIPRVSFVPYDPVIINRGGLEIIPVNGVGDFRILPVVNRRIQDWDASCPLCEMGSKPIKPKATDENWRLITTSQLAQTALE